MVRVRFDLGIKLLVRDRFGPQFESRTGRVGSTGALVPCRVCPHGAYGLLEWSRKRGRRMYPYDCTCQLLLVGCSAVFAFGKVGAWFL